MTSGETVRCTFGPKELHKGAEVIKCLLSGKLDNNAETNVEDR